jgi:hypothetical protein
MSGDGTFITEVKLPDANKAAMTKEEEDRLRTKLEKISTIDVTMGNLELPESFDADSPLAFPRKDRPLRK